MSLEFAGTPLFQKVAVKFIQAFLPEAKKPYYLRTAVRQELDIRQVADMAGRFNITTSPDVIVEGFNAAVELIIYLVACGFTIRTALFTLRLRIRGEYDGWEENLPDGVRPEAAIQAGLVLDKYLRDHVEIEILGQVTRDACIAEVRDEATGLVDETASIGRLLTIHGNGLKIEADDEKKELAGVFFIPANGLPVKTVDIAINEPRTLRIVVPQGLEEGRSYTIAVETQSSITKSCRPLKNMRDMRSDFTVIARR